MYLLSYDLFFIDKGECWSKKQHPGRQPLCVRNYFSTLCLDGEESFVSLGYIYKQNDVTESNTLFLRKLRHLSLRRLFQGVAISSIKNPFFSMLWIFLLSFDQYPLISVIPCLRAADITLSAHKEEKPPEHSSPAGHWIALGTGADVSAVGSCALKCLFAGLLRHQEEQTQGLF